MPKKVILDPEEIDRVNRVRVARYLGKLPSQVDVMPYEDFADCLAIMRADVRIDHFDAEKAKAQRKRKKK